MTEPVPPTNVCFVLDDGTVVPVDCAYDGFIDGVHRWRIVNAPADPTRIRKLTADVLPGHTAIDLAVLGHQVKAKDLRWRPAP